MRKVYYNHKIVKDYISKKGLTVEEFCQKCGISRYVYRQFMQNDGRLTMPKILNIANLLKVNPIKLFMLEGNVLF